MKRRERSRIFTTRVLIQITALFLSEQFIAKNLIQNGEFNECTGNWIVRLVNSGNSVVVQFIINDEELLSGQNCMMLEIENS